MNGSGRDADLRTALVVIDPYNDFLSVGGRGWLLNRATLAALRTNLHLTQLLDHARAIGVQVCYAPHARYRRGLYSDRRFLNPSAFLAKTFRTFGAAGWGGRFRKGLEPRAGEFVAEEHLVSSGFVGTDLDAHLSHQGIEHVILCGCLSNTCVESTARSAIELGYQVTVITDALAAMSLADHAAAVSAGFPMCAHRTTTAQDWIRETSR